MVRNIYFIEFNRYLIRKNTTNYSKSQQATEAEAGHFLYFDCNLMNTQLILHLRQEIVYSTYFLSLEVGQTFLQRLEQW